MVSVNGVAIGEDAIDQEMQYHPSPNVQAARRAAAEALVVRELLLQEARRRALSPGPALEEETADEALTRTLLESAIQVPEPDEGECRRFFEASTGRYRSPDLFEAAHIFLPAAPRDEIARTVAKSRAEGLILELQAEPGHFAALAREHSRCSSAAEGGALGQIVPGQTTPEFETFLYATEPGQLCPVPVPTAYGFHVLRVDRREDGRLPPFELVRERVASDLRDLCWRRAVHQFIQLLAGQASIEGVALAGASSPLVQ
jgi:peptidyl-prolyl cis-trans isomerase C